MWSDVNVPGRKVCAMFKSAAISLVLIVGVLAVAASSLLLANESRPAEEIAQTGTAIDYLPNQTSIEPCAPTERTCAAYINAAVDSQWQLAAAEVLRSLRQVRRFTASDRKQLAEREKNRSARQKFFLRLAVLKQLTKR